MDFQIEDVLVRQTTKDDIDTLLLFEQGVINAERAFDPTLKQEETVYYDLMEMIHSENVRLLVAD